MFIGTVDRQSLLQTSSITPMIHCKSVWAKLTVEKVKEINRYRISDIRVDPKHINPSIMLTSIESSQKIRLEGKKQ